MRSNSYHDLVDQAITDFRVAVIPPAGWAYLAAEAVRALNHATINPGGYTYPADVYSVIGNLQTLAQRIPQALDQEARHLRREHTAGRAVDAVDGTRSTLTIAEAVQGLGEAAAIAGQLADALAAAHVPAARLAHLEHTTDDAVAGER